MKPNLSAPLSAGRSPRHTARRAPAAQRFRHALACLPAALLLAACGGGGGGGAEPGPQATAPEAPTAAPPTRATALAAAPQLPAGSAPVVAVVYRCGNVALGALRSGNIEVPPGQVCVLQGTRVDGNIQLGAGSVLDAREVNVIGSVQADGAADVLLAASSISGSVQLKQGGSATLQALRVGGDIQLEQNLGALLVEANIVQGSLQVMANRAGATLLGNRAGGNLQCKDNLPAPVGSANTAASLEDQCRALPAPPAAGAPGTPGTPGAPGTPPPAPAPQPPLAPTPPGGGLPAPTLPPGVFSPGSNVSCLNLSLGAATYASVTVPASARCELRGTRLTGNLELGPGASVDSVNSEIAGSVQGDGPGTLQMSGGRVDGAVQTQRGAATTLAGVRIGGSVQFDAATGLLWLQALTVTGDIQLIGNRGGAVLNDNRAGGNLQCKDNLPAPGGSGNRAASKQDQCSAL
jgi:ubiquinone biosynthesis protein UbiJ